MSSHSFVSLNGPSKGLDFSRYTRTSSTGSIRYFVAGGSRLLNAVLIFVCATMFSITARARIIALNLSTWLLFKAECSVHDCNVSTNDNDSTSPCGSIVSIID